MLRSKTLKAEMDEELGYDKYNYSEKQTSNSRNGYSKKTLKTELGPVDINVPRDRSGNFEPKIIPKHKRSANVIESLNSQFRKVTKTKLIFPNDDSLLKMLYFAVQRVETKWAKQYRDWDLVINQLNIVFSDILNPAA